MPTHDAPADRLDRAAAAILDLQARTEAAGPWALAELYGTEAEASWGPPEVLAHLEEMLPFWQGEMERILDGPGPDPVPFGRVASDVVRIGIIGRDRTLPLRELFARVRNDAARMSARLRALSPADLERVGLHPRLGAITVGDSIERFVVGHLEEHVVQLTEILDTRSA
jgi:hypothetical protein